MASSPTANFSNSTGEDWSSSPRNVFLDTVNTVIAFLAVLGNGMVIAVMLARRRVFSSFTNHLILHQSIIDSIAGVMFFLYKVVKHPTTVVSSEGTFSDELVCRLLYTEVLLWTVVSASTYNLVIISLERLMATCYPVIHRNSWSMTKLKFALAASWCIGVIYGSHSLFVFEAGPGQCQVVPFGLAMQIFLGIAVIAIEFFVPVTIMIYAYTRILIMLTKKLANQENGQQNFIPAAKRNVLITTLMTGIMFAVCWTPSEFIYMDVLFFGNSWVAPLPTISTAMLACNMFVNPIIYCFKYEHFRSQLKDLVLKRLLRRNQVHDG